MTPFQIIIVSAFVAAGAVLIVLAMTGNLS